MDFHDNPIGHLYDQIILSFELSNDEMNRTLIAAMDKGLISRAIYIDPSFDVIKTPEADLITKEIKLQGTYLSYVWAVCYVSIGLQNLVHTNIVDNVNVLRTNDFPEMEQLASTINWAVRQYKFRSVWPEGLPLPSYDNQRVQETNMLFLYTIRYLMYHEAAHLILHNTDSALELIRKLKSKQPLRNDELRRLRIMELQADEYAFDAVYISHTEQPELYMKSLGAIVAHLSSLYILKGASTRGGTHPDYDTRIKKILKKVDSLEEPYHTFIHSTLTIGLQVFLEMHKVDYINEIKKPDGYESFSELEDDLFGVIDRQKA